MTSCCERERERAKDEETICAQPTFLTLTGSPTSSSTRSRPGGGVCFLGGGLAVKHDVDVGAQDDFNHQGGKKKRQAHTTYEGWQCERGAFRRRHQNRHHRHHCHHCRGVCWLCHCAAYRAAGLWMILLFECLHTHTQEKQVGRGGGGV